MKRFFAKLCIFAVPLVLLVGVELMCPNDAFTFRSWEALVVKDRLVDTPLVRLFPYTALPGPFLPRARLERIEEGDLGHHTPFAERHAVVWETDEYGYRVRSSPIPAELVVVGDSTVVGTGLSQEDTLAEVLRRDHGIQAYPFAPATMASFLMDKRFRDRPPRFVVITCIERDVLELFKAPEVLQAKPRDVQWVQNDLLKTVEFGWVRAKRLNVLEYLRARINGRPSPVVYSGVTFLKGPEAIEKPDPKRLRAVADTLAVYTALGRERGFRVALMVVPDKETIYANLLPGAPSPELLTSLHRVLRQKGLAAIDIESAFQTAWQKRIPLYLKDDTHWNATAVRMAAQAVKEWVQSDGS